MTTLLVDKLVETLSQDITVTSSNRIHVAAFIPYIYMCNAPAGTFTFSLIQNSITIFSKTFTSTEIKTSLATSNNYAHAFYPLIPDYLVQMSSGSYTVKLSASGYTPSESSYLGWIRQFENIQNEMSYTPTTDRQNPLAIRIKTYKKE